MPTLLLLLTFFTSLTLFVRLSALMRVDLAIRRNLTENQLAVIQSTHVLLLFVYQLTLWLLYAHT